MIEGVKKKSSYLAIDRITRLAVSLFSGAIIARALGPEEFGFFAQMLLGLSLFDALAGLGIGGVIAARVTQMRIDKRSKFLIVATSIRMAFTFFLLVVFLVSAKILFPDKIIIFNEFLLIAIFVGVLFNNWLIMEGYLNGVGSPHHAAISKSLISIFVLTIRLIYINNHEASIEGFIIIFLVEQLLLTILLMFLSFRSQSKDIDAVETKIISNLFPYTLSMWMSQLATLIYMRVDQVVLSIYASKSVVGMYMLSISIVELTFSIPIMMNAILISYIGNIRTNKKISSTDFYKTIINFYRIGFYISLLLVLIFIIISEFFIILIYGEQFIDAIPIFRILILSLPFVTIGSIQLLSIYTGDDPYIHLRKTISVAVITPFLAFAGWYTFGIYGLAWSVVLSQAIGCYFINFYYDLASFKSQSYAIFSRRVDEF